MLTHRFICNTHDPAHRRAGAVPASEKQSIKLMSPHLESECSEIPSMEVFVVVNQLVGDPYFLRSVAACISGGL